MDVNLKSLVLVICVLLNYAHCKNVNKVIEKHNEINIRSQTGNQCPVAEDILPCVCYYNANPESHRIDCSQVQDNDELKRAFKSFHTDVIFRELRIIGLKGKVTITKLEDDTFGPVKFQNIRISKTNLKSISSNAFYGSFQVLEYLKLDRNQIEDFPFENLNKFFTLHVLHLQYNNLVSMPDLETTHLQYLNLNNNTGLEFSYRAFYHVNNLLTLELENLGLTHIDPKTFRNLNNLKSLNLAYNKLNHIEAYTFQFPMSTLIELVLSNNEISDMAQNSVSGKYIKKLVLNYVLYYLFCFI